MALNHMTLGSSHVSFKDDIQHTILIKNQNKSY